ncbi:MAG: hypothetical protein R3B40_26055 [Polyangiales bacterium]
MVQERIVPFFPKAVVMLDAYHLLEALAKYATARFLAGTASNKRFYQRALDASSARAAARSRGRPSPAEATASARPRPSTT